MVGGTGDDCSFGLVPGPLSFSSCVDARSTILAQSHGSMPLIEVCDASRRHYFAAELEQEQVSFALAEQDIRTRWESELETERQLAAN